MKGTKNKVLTIFLCALIAILFSISIIFTLIKNDMLAKEKYYREQNEIITPKVDDE